MPLNLAIFNTGATNAVIDAYPQISNWILAGHSPGGASAAIFAENNPKRINAIALWDSYLPDKTYARFDHLSGMRSKNNDV